MDKKDEQILNILREDSSLTTREIAKKTCIPITTVHKRIKKLKQLGIIKNFTININHKKVGKKIAAYILISANLEELKQKKKTQQTLAQALKKIEEVEEVTIVTGSIDLITRIRVKEIEDLNKVILEKIQTIEGIADTQTVICMEELRK